MKVSARDSIFESKHWQTIVFKNHTGCPAFCIKWFIVAASIAKNRHSFRSFASIDIEKQRQLLLPYFIIHPFSAFRFFWETWMIFVYFAALIFLPFEACNFFYTQINEKNFVNYGIPVMMIHVNLFMDIIISLFTGYVERDRNRVNLERKKIARKYFKTYFIIDVLATVPALLNAIPFYFLTGKPICPQIIILNFSIICRVCTLSTYCRNFVIRFQFYGTVYRILFIIMFSVFFFHWTACGIFVFPFTFSTISTNGSEQKSWLNTIALELDKVPVGSLYFASLINSINFALSCTAGPKLSSTLEFFTKLICGIFGTLYICYNFVLLLILIRTKMEPETKYDEFVTEVKDYMRHNQLPASVQKRMLLYYEHRFQRIYFNEQAIMKTLPANLRQDIRDIGVYRLLAKVKLFDMLSKDVVKTIADAFILRIYLPKDVIKPKGFTNYTYFILHGTVALYTSSGHEITHLHDGNYFGLATALFNDRSSTIVMAVDVCEIYLLRQDIFLKAIITNKEVYDCIYQDTRVRIKHIKAVETKHRDSENQELWEFRYST